MKAIKSILATALISATLLTSCGNANNSKDDGAKTVSLAKFTNDKADVSQHLFLRIVDESQTDSSHIYVVKSVYETDTVGLKVEVLKDIKPGIDGHGRPVKNGFVKGAIKFSSIGTESDALLKALGSIFELQSSGVFSVNTILPTVFSSNSDNVDLTKNSSYNFKLFLDNAVGEPAEVFAILDLYKRSFEFTEKDSSYRAQLLSALEGK